MIQSILKAAICLAIEVFCILMGYGIPTLFGRDVGGGLASTIGAGIGSLIGVYLGLWAIRRIFD